MATANRADRRRAERSKSNGKAAEAAPQDSADSEVKPPEAEEGKEQISGVFVRVTGMGKYQVEVEPLGETRVTEIQTILELALRRAKEMIRLDE